MEKISYLATFLSLILGLAVANVLSRLSGMLKRGRAADWYYIHTLWAVYILFLLACEWWVILTWAGEASIGFLVYLFLLTKPCVLFMASDVLFPDSRSDDALDLKAHYWSIHRRFFYILAIYPLLDVVDTLLKGVDHLKDLGPLYAVAIVLGVGAVLVGGHSRNEKVHLGLVVFMFIIVSASMMNALSSV